jgi:PAS domain S-box-containing protein
MALWRLEMSEATASENLTLDEVVNIDDLQNLQNKFSEATDISSVIIDLDGRTLTRVSGFNPVCRLIGETEKGRCLCDRSDKVRNDLARKTRRPFYHRCLSCGFVDASVPIFINDRHVANWLIGQVNAAGIERDDMAKFARKVGADVDQVLKAFECLPEVSIEKLEKMMELVRQMAAEVSEQGYSNFRLRHEAAESRETADPAEMSRDTIERLLNLSPAVILRCGPGPEYVISYISDNVISCLGYVPDQFYEDPGFWRSQVHPDDIDAVETARQSLQHGQLVNTEYRIRTRDGRWIWLYEQITPFFDTADAQFGHIVSWSDITSRKASEENLNLAVSELRKLDSIIHRSPAIVFVWRMDKDWSVEYVSENVEQLGYSSEDFITGRVSWRGIAHPDDVPRLEREVADNLDRGVTEFAQEYRLIDAAGEVRWVEDRNKVVCDASGQPTHVQGIVFETTDRRRAEQELRVSQQRIRALLDATYDSMMLMDRDGIILEANRSMATRMGMPLDQVIGKCIWDLLPPEVLESRRAWNDRVAESGKPHRSVDQRAGYWFDTMVYPVFDDAGEVVGTAAYARDITERKRAEAELMKTQKLESVGILAAGIAHDFNNILGGILSSVSLVMTDLDPNSETYAILKMAESATVRAADLTGRLLTFSRGGTPVKNRVRIEELVRDSAALALSGANVRASFDFSDDLYEIDADESQLGQVFQNLVINACQAMPGGGVVEIQAENGTLDKSAWAEPTLGEGIVVSITDCGKGISPENLKKIFDPFFTTKPTSSGLGLATCYSIVKNHGGQIEVDSEPNDGTTVRVFLPVGRKVEGTSEMAIPGAEDKEVPNAPDATGQRVLVMDDEAILRDMVSRILTRAGYEVDCATDGDRAVEAYVAARDGGDPYNLVLLDLTVAGGCGGVDTLRRLKEIDPKVRAIVCSGYYDDPVISDFLNHGFVGAIIKPFSARHLTATVAKLLVPA